MCQKKIWKIKKWFNGVEVYVETDDRFDSGYCALQLTREKIDRNLCAFQRFDEEQETIDSSIPYIKLQSFLEFFEKSQDCETIPGL